MHKYVMLRNRRQPRGVIVFGKHAKGRRKPKDYAAKKRTRRLMAKKSRQRNAAKMKGRS